MEFEMNKIRQICIRYFDGDSTAEEEMQLRTYFRLAENIPDDLQAVKIMICGFEETAKITYSPSAKKTSAISRKGLIKKLIWGTIATAASIAICISLFNKEIYGYDTDGKAITDPEAALEGTKYLSYLSKLETTIDIAHMITQGMENNN